MSKPSASTNQIISLPKGGGAMKGIGESFSPDLHTGTGNFSVPIALPPGRIGFQPELVLGYSTGNGNGPFGAGWALSVPGVSRKTSRGIPRYRDSSQALAERDTFVLSGAEDLVLVKEEPGRNSYRPRTEGLFARIEHHWDATSNYWKVHNKNGFVSHYGTPELAGADPAVVADPGDPYKVFCWKLQRTTDLFGNVIEYEHLRDTGDEADHVWDQSYLRQIRYVDLPPDAPSRFLVTVTFVYQDRPDPSSDYRAGFEIRTRKRCTRIEVRTHADTDRLVRVYHLVYLDERGLPPEELPANGMSLLSRVVVEGIDGDESEELPPLEFSYTKFQPESRRYQPMTAIGDALPNGSLSNPEFELVNLFGNGLPDIVQMNSVVRYWRNLGGGSFDFPRIMEFAPSQVSLSDSRVQFADANGNGRADLLVLGGPLPGYYPLTARGDWDSRGFVPYAQVPSIDLDAPDVRLMDLDGDGVTDAMRTAGRLEFYYSDAKTGWNTVESREREDSDTFPNVDFTNPRVKQGDLTGDGLQDIALIHNGFVAYWPYLGYGRWGRRVAMRNSPRFDDFALDPLGFDPGRLLLGDVDGDGLADIVYVASDHITVWINQQGNSWSDPIVVSGTPPVDNISSVRLADMHGNGTDGILWTYDSSSGMDTTYKFLDLTGGVKPYLLSEMNNHLGAITKVEYTSSARYYVEDQQRPETRWKTSLPFPVHVVARVEVIDELSEGKLTTEYRYHHGYWDGEEREFRGFGIVEQIDTETFDQYHGAGLHGATRAFLPVASTNFSAPILTRTWFHQGPVQEDEGDWQELDWTYTYWQGDPPTVAHTQAVNTFLAMLPDRTARRAALRALRGSVLRTELYALDGSLLAERPYTVTESAYGLREVSAPTVAQPERLRVFFPHQLLQRTTQWERGTDPMTSFAFTDDYDEFGRPHSQIGLAVPRARDWRVPAAAPVEPYLGTQTLTTFCQRDDATHYFVDRVSGTSTFEIVNDGSHPLFDLYRAVRSETAQRKLFAQSFNYYDGPAFVGLSFGQLGDFGAVTRTESLALTEEILGDAYRESATSPLEIPPYMRPEGVISWGSEFPQPFRDSMPTLAGYVFAPGGDHRSRGYFVQASRVELDVQRPQLPFRRGLPVTVRDPLGSDVTIVHDRFRFLPQSTTDAAGLTVTAIHDYRVLQPKEVTDANGNRSSLVISPLGLVQAVFVRGKEGANEGDLLRPSTRLIYDLLAFLERGQPVSVRSIRSEHHDSETDVPLPERDATIETVEYSDGFGRVIQTRVQAEDVLFGDASETSPLFGASVVPADQEDTVGTMAPVQGRLPGDEPNVVVSGWQTYDNKGRVVEKYEPFYSTGWDFRPPAESQLGQRVTMFYDPRGQAIRTVNPDGSEQLVIYGVPKTLSTPHDFVPTPWEAYTYDANDNAGRTHAEQSRKLYRHHWDTPSHIEIDALGRTRLAVQRNRREKDAPLEEYETRSSYDIRGNVLIVKDALDRDSFTYTYNLANQVLRTDSIDAGMRRIVLNAVGNEVERRDSKGAIILQAYDVLHRSIRFWARDNAGHALTLRQHLQYGDDPTLNQAAMRAANLLGKLHRHHDEAGLVNVEHVDFKGNLLEKTRHVIADAPILAVFDTAASNNWKIDAFRVDWTAAVGGSLAEREAALIDPTEYRTSVAYDALNRSKLMRYPRDVEGNRKALQPQYNRAGALERISLDGTVFAERIVYNAKGQRTLIAYGNGIMTRHAYEGATFRLARLLSQKYTKGGGATYLPGDGVLQDFAYRYDLAGNILSILDRTPDSGILNNPQAINETGRLAQLLVSGDALIRKFEYDAIYRLASATGRECDRPPEGLPWLDEPRCEDVTRTRAYEERYLYDAAGNMLELAHSDAPSRQFAMEADNGLLVNNHLKQLTIGQAAFDYKFDVNGNMTDETSSRHFEWGHSDQMKAFRTQTVGAEPSICAHYLYDPSGLRVKKLVRRQGGQIDGTVYVDDFFEHQTKRQGASFRENNTFQVMDDRSRVALVRVGEPFPDDPSPATTYYLADHLGSANLIIGSDGSWINHEEFTPYGEGSFGSFSGKRYRFTGMERDKETGLSYHAARYYSVWLCRWLSADPSGSSDGLNLYAYTTLSPLMRRDPTGLDSCEALTNVCDINDPDITEGPPFEGPLPPELSALDEDVAQYEFQWRNRVPDGDLGASDLGGTRELSSQLGLSEGDEEATQALAVDRTERRYTGGWVPYNTCPGSIGIGCAEMVEGDDNHFRGSILDLDHPRAPVAFSLLSLDAAARSWNAEGQRRFGPAIKLATPQLRVGDPVGSRVEAGGPSGGLNLNYSGDAVSIGGGLSLWSLDGTLDYKGASAHFGVSAGPSLGFRLSAPITERDGVTLMTIGAGGEAGPFSVDVKVPLPMLTREMQMRFLYGRPR